MKRLLFIIISVIAFLCGCGDDEAWTRPTTLKGGVWRLETPLPLRDYFTYQTGRCIAFSESSSQGWLGWNEKDRYRVNFTYEPVRDRRDAYVIYLHTSIEFSYYISDINVDSDKASFLLFASYNDFYLYHVKGDGSMATPVSLVLERRCR